MDATGSYSRGVTPGAALGEWVVPVNDERKLPQRIADQLARAIVEHRLSAGSRLSEAELAQAFGTSRTPVREALQELESKSLVERLPRRGARVPELSAREALNVYVCRAHLYGLSARLAAPHLTEENFERLSELLDQMQHVVDAEPADYLWLNVEFHTVLANAADNDLLLSLMERMGWAALRFRFLSITIPGRIHESIRGHHELMTALRRRDSRKAEEIVMRTITAAGDAVMAHFFQDDSAPVSRIVLDAQVLVAK